MAKIAFVTGGTGFIGSHLVEALLERGYREVRCLVRTCPRWLEGLDIVPVRGDLEDAAQLRTALEGVDEVYHVAGVTRATSWGALKKGNIDATLSLLRAVRDAGSSVQKVIVASSLAAVGTADTAVVDEQVALCPLTRYGRSKAMMEKALAQPDESGRCLREVLPLVVVRPPAVYGPRDVDIFVFFKMLHSGLCLIPGTGGKERLSLVHVHDLVRGMLMAAASEKTSGQTYFLGSEEAVSWQELKKVAAAALGRRVWTIPIPRAFIGPLGTVVEGVGRLFGQYPPLNREKAREILHAAKICSSAKAHHDFGYQQKVSLKKGVHETITWYREQGWLP